MKSNEADDIVKDNVHVWTRNRCSHEARSDVSTVEQSDLGIIWQNVCYLRVKIAFNI